MQHDKNLSAREGPRVITVKARKRLPSSERKQHILDAAEQVLATQGYEKFRFRNIAAHANLHFATLQYYFSSKDKLLSALVQSKLVRDKELLQTALEKAKGSAEEKFINSIELMASESQEPLVAGFFAELWALSNHNQTAAKHLHDYYQAYLAWVLELIDLVNPKLAAQERRLKAISIMSLLEGIVPVSAIGGVGRMSRKSLNTGVGRIAWYIASS